MIRHGDSHYSSTRLEDVRRRQRLVLDDLVRRGTVIECCPTSNLRIGGVPDGQYGGAPRHRERSAVTTTAASPLRVAGIETNSSSWRAPQAEGYYQRGERAERSTAGLGGSRMQPRKENPRMDDRPQPNRPHAQDHEPSSVSGGRSLPTDAPPSSAASPRERLLVDWVYAPPVGHAIGGLKIASDWVRVNPDLDVSLLLNSRSAPELAGCVPGIARVDPIDLGEFAAPAGPRPSLEAVPRDWDYLFTDPRHDHAMPAECLERGLAGGPTICASVAELERRLQDIMALARALIREERPYLQCIREHYEALRSRLVAPPGAILLGHLPDVLTEEYVFPSTG